MQRGNQHGGREYDDLQDLLDMTSHDNPLLLHLGLKVRVLSPEVLSVKWQLLKVYHH